MCNYIYIHIHMLTCVEMPTYTHSDRNTYSIWAPQWDILPVETWISWVPSSPGGFGHALHSSEAACIKDAICMCSWPWWSMYLTIPLNPIPWNPGLHTLRKPPTLNLKSPWPATETPELSSAGYRVCLTQDGMHVWLQVQMDHQSTSVLDITSAIYRPVQIWVGFGVHGAGEDVRILARRQLRIEQKRKPNS